MSNNKEYLDKHQPLTQEELHSQLKEAEKSRAKYQKDITDTETALMAFMNRTDPVVDPATDTAIAWVRQLTMKELREMTPDAVRTAAREGKEAVEGVMKDNPEMEKYTYELMATMITDPVKTAEEWEGFANPEFIALFEAKVSEMYARISEKIDFF